jgi:hypothetical protein
MSRQHVHRDPTVERAHLSQIGEVLNTITNRREVGIVVLIVIWGLSIHDAARRMHLTDREAQFLLNKALSRLRHPSRAQGIYEEMFGEYVTRSAELRRWAQAAAESLMVICPVCQRRFIPEHIFVVTGGRPPTYCSNACRQKAYRARRSA